MFASALVFSLVAGVPAVIPTVSVRPPRVPAPLVSCRSADCLGPWQVVTMDEGLRMKRQFGERAMLVDVRSNSAAVRGSLIPTDTHVAFVRRESPVEFQVDFMTNVDEALRARHLAHDAPVIVYAGSREYGILAALLLQEHGYSKIYVAV
jgi:rhodanese-related sulfurtransferase